MDLMDIIVIGIAVCSSLILWFQTDFLFEYLNVFPFLSNHMREFALWKIDVLNDWKSKRRSEDSRPFPQLKYLNFINHKWKGNFLVKLVSCPFCLGFWLSLIYTLIYLIFPLAIQILAVYWIGLFLYFLHKKNV